LALVQTAEFLDQAMEQCKAAPAAAAKPAAAPAQRTRSTRSAASAAAPRAAAAAPRAAASAGRARGGGAAGRGGVAGRGRGRGVGGGKVAAPSLLSISHELSQQLQVHVQEKKCNKTMNLADTLTERGHDEWVERVAALKLLPDVLQNQVDEAQLPEALQITGGILAVLMRGNQQIAADAHLQVSKATLTLALPPRPQPWP